MRTVSAVSLFLLAVSVPVATAFAAPGLRVHRRIDGTFFDGRLGAHVRAGLDVDGDQVPDIIASEYTSSPLGRDRAGAVRVYSGADGRELIVIPGTRYGDFFSAQADLIEDIDGDGLADIVIGAPETTLNDAPKTGRVYVYGGRSGRLIRTHDGVFGEDQFGFAVARVGNGRGDYLVSAIFGRDRNGRRVGYVNQYDGRNGFAYRRYEGEIEESSFGHNMKNAQDVDGDGVDDIIIGAPRAEVGGRVEAGQVYVFSGMTGRRILRIDGRGLSDLLGYACDGTGDVDGDGRGDIVVGAPFANDANVDRVGQSYVFSGADGHVIYSYDGIHTHSTMGLSVCRADDVNEDGVPDFWVGSAHDECLPVYAVKGQLFLKSGADGSTLYAHLGGPDTDFGDIHGVGFTTDIIGDIDGDGLSDYVSGAVDSVVGTVPFAGCIFVYTVDRSKLAVTGDARPGGDLLLSLEGYPSMRYKIGASILGGPRQTLYAFPDGPGNYTYLDIDLSRLDLTRRAPGFIGDLDAAGRAQVPFRLPNNSKLSGRSVWFQFGLMNPVRNRPPRVKHVSNSFELPVR